MYSDTLLDLGFKGFILFILVFARVLSVFVQAPIFGSRHITMRARVGLGFVLTIALFPLLPIPKDLPSDVLSITIAVMIQIAIGLSIGFVSFIVFAAAEFAGSLVDTQLGLSIASSFDPVSGTTLHLISRFYFYMTMTIYLMINGHHYLIKALYASFKYIPLAWHINVSPDFAQLIIRVSAVVYNIALNLCLPALAALFIGQVALGMLARVTPQLNVFMLSFALNILIGVTLVGLALPYLYQAITNYLNHFAYELAKVVNVLR